MEKKHRFALPRSLKNLQEGVYRLLELPKLAELRVTPGGIELTRSTDEPIPSGILQSFEGAEDQYPEIELIIEAVALDVLAFDPSHHPLTVLLKLFEAVTSKDLRAVAWYAPADDSLDAYLGLPESTLPQSLFGLPVRYVAPSMLENKLLLLASETAFAMDASYGIVADIGVL
jgi:hypothetical protein